jgi:PBSX family phage terminase large subunit
MKFDTISPKQAEIFTFPHENYDALICDGAVRTGKTVMGITSFVEWAMNTFNECNLGICGKTVRSAERNIVMPLMQIRSITKKYQILFTRSISLMTIKRNGRVNYFYIFGGKDESSYMLIQGVTLCGVFFDEVALMPESFVEQAIARTISISNAKLWFNCNPENPLHWFYTEWICQPEKHKAKYLHFLMNDNPGLTPEQIEKAKADFAGVFYQRYILGEWVAAEGRIYPMFDRKENVYNDSTRPLELEALSVRYSAVDYGTENPCAWLDIFDDGDTLWIDNESYYDGRKEHKPKTNDEYADDFCNFFEARPPLRRVVVDPSAAAFKEQLRRRGFVIKDGDNDVLEGIQKVASLIYRRKIKVHERCVHFLNEIDSYVWDEKARTKGIEQPLKENDHLQDCLRYFVNTIIPKWRLASQ